MWIDLIIAGILILFVFRGYRRGVIASLIGIIGWAVSFIAAFLLYPFAIDFLDAKTGIRSTITEHIVSYVKNRMISQMSTPDGSQLPDAVRAVLHSSSSSELAVKAAEAAEPLANLFMDIVAFIAVLVLFRILFKIIQMISMHFTGEDHGIVGIMNSLGGLFFGLVEGIILSYLLLLFLDYLVMFTDIMVLSHQLDDSIVMNVVSRLDLIPYAGNIDELIN